MSNKVVAKVKSGAAGTPAVDPIFTIWTLLHQTAYAITRAREKELKRYGIAIRQVAALLVISNLGDRATPTELARWLFRKPHTVSSMLTRMEKEGLIAKSKDLERKNVIRVTLTEKGKGTYQQSTRRESIHRIMSCLDEKELGQLSSLLERLRERAFGELGGTSTTLPPLEWPSTREVKADARR